MKIAIVGSRKYPRLDLPYHLLLGILPPKCEIHTGDATGIDAEIRTWCTRLSLNPLAQHTLIVHPANWARHGKQAGAIRNNAIMQNAEALIAFWDGHSPGTHQSIEIARSKDIPTWIYGPTGLLMPQELSLFGPANLLSLPSMDGPEFALAHEAEALV